MVAVCEDVDVPVALDVTVEVGLAVEVTDDVGLDVTVDVRLSRSLPPAASWYRCVRLPPPAPCQYQSLGALVYVLVLSRLQ